MKMPLLKENGPPNKIGGKYLEQCFPDDNKEESLRILEGQIRECYGRVVYSHKSHEKCADILLSRLNAIKLWQIILSSITTAGFIAIILGASKVGAIIGTLISAILLILNSYTKNYDLGELVQKHKQAADSLWIIRESYLSLLTDIKISPKSLEDIKKRRDELTKNLHVIYEGSPRTTFSAYKKAQEALKKFNDMSFTDSEIDEFLPGELKRINN